MNNVLYSTPYLHGIPKLRVQQGQMGHLLLQLPPLLHQGAAHAAAGKEQILPAVTLGLVRCCLRGPIFMAAASPDLVRPLDIAPGDALH
jgi:hypothetical protein